ncbi:Serine/threonine-protein kinase domain protein [Ophiocordyceps sinensis CO18]|nr:Serine/threonine-protein kinase domain protein [Ophiocordyceps sinensis CO18]
MERSLSQDIREEREELREAAEQTLNAIIDLNLDGTVKWVSPSWTDVVGTPFETVNGIPISDLIVSENKTVFSDVIDSMKRDDSKSYRVSFAIQLGPLSKLRSADSPDGLRAASQPSPQTADLEAQGIMVYDSVSGGESHVMWMLRPWSGPHEIKIDLPQVIVDSLGSGAEVLAGYLTRLAESGVEEPDPPPSVLCRICERQIPPWWFEKHTDLCLQEHRAEMDVQMAQDNLTEHRHAIVKVLDDLESRRSRSIAGETQAWPLAEYKGIPIGPPPSTQSSPGTSMARSRDRTSGFGHSRARSFAVRRPQARIVELLMDLCDTAIEINNPAIKESTSQQDDGELRTQSPQSESRISQVLQWQSPSTNTLEQEQGLALLCSDTEKVARAKVDAVFRHRRIIEYAERIRIELAVLAQDCIDRALRKAARLAAGRLSDSTEDEEDLGLQEGLNQKPEADVCEVAGGDAPAEGELRGRLEEGLAGRPLDSPSALATALRQMDMSAASSRSRSRPTSFIASTRSSSPRECPTPRSHAEGGLGSHLLSRDARRVSSLLYETEVSEVEGSMRSSSFASRNAPRTESPISEFGDLRRAASARQHHRRSLVIPGTSSPRRQESPSRSTQPSSPLRIKPRVLPFSHEGVMSPEASPMFLSSEFSSPVSHPSRHHRRQSSAAISDLVMRAPPSPRLSASQAPPQARPAQPSIKDFEIIKPISKGAFGSVYLSKKKSTGEYFAIKVLKKADMVAKNQVGNVKAERAIMMWQGQSEFVAKLYWTFSSKDYLYLVMEYLNGGDCASLIKVLGGLPEDWVTKYLGEVVLGVEHLHERDVIHRDLKPDNLLIDQKGHLKLTDFGLSRMGLVGRQKRALNSETSETTPDLLKQGPFARSTSMASSRSTSLDLHGHAHSPGTTPQTTPDAGSTGQPSFFSLSSQQEPRRISSSHRSDSGGSENMAHMFSSLSLNDSEPHSQPLSARLAVDEEALVQGSSDLPASHANARASVDGRARSSLPQSSMMPPAMALFSPQDTNRRFVGTPDYLAPETIKGDKQDETSDWWSVGCIMFEFLYGTPPFHADEAEQVFENILARRIQWPDESNCEPISDEAKDLINKLLCMDPKQRLGANREGKLGSGGEEIRSHQWFQGINWATLLEDEAQFVPRPENPEDTEYFDARGAVLQSFAEEVEDQMSPQSSTAGSEYPDRPHDALSRVRSQVNSVNRKLMPLHIPPHVRDLKSRRLSEPVPMDDFGSFTFKNLPVLEKANKDVIQKLRADALAAQSKQSSASPGASAAVTSPAPSLDASPVLSNHLHRTISGAKAGNRPQSPSGFSHSNSSPSRASQPSSPLLVSFVAGQGAEGRRKASSNSSSLSHQSTSLQPPAAFEVPKVPPSLQKAATSAAASPVKSRGTAPAPLPLSPQKMVATPRQGSGSSTGRSRSLTLGSQEASPVTSEVLQHHRNRRSQVFDMSPSSSDNEGDKHNALLRVQRRRQSSRRLSQITFDTGPTFRPLDVLICEDHPVSRMVMEKLLEKLRCRTISVANGSEAVRYSMSEIQFDVIFLEYKLPQINGADVARMIRETNNANSHTPIVAITAYLKELQAPHYFDSLIEKPISSSKLTEVLRSLCQWRPDSPLRAASGPLPHPMPRGLRKASARADDSPVSGMSVFAGPQGSAIASSREDSFTSSLFGDSESATTDDIPAILSRKGTGDWDESGGLGIAEVDMVAGLEPPPRVVPPLLAQHSAPGQMEHTLRQQDKTKSKQDESEKKAVEGTESADDEDEEGEVARDKQVRRASKPLVGKSALPSSKLGIEMMRADSHESVTMGSESTPEAMTQVATTPLQEVDTPVLGTGGDEAAHTPPGANPQAQREERPGIEEEGNASVDATPRPTPLPRGAEDEPTPRPAGK